MKNVTPSARALPNLCTQTAMFTLLLGFVTFTKLEDKLSLGLTKRFESYFWQYIRKYSPADDPLYCCHPRTPN